MAAFFCAPAVAGTGDQPSVAVYYGNDVPVEMLNQFDWAVVEAAHVSDEQFEALQKYGTTAFAYVSVGEAEHWRGADAAPKQALKARNENWNSQAADLGHSEWGDYIVNERIRPLWQAGYRALFLDTLDSYRLFAKDDASAAEQQKALVALIKRIRSEFPGVKLLLNRGFEILDQVQGEIVGVAAESLYKSWDARTQSYRDVKPDDTQYVLDKLTQVRDTYDLPAIAIDYVAPADRDEARATAQRIADAGIVPWVSNGALNQVGVGSIEPMPRKVLVLYDNRATEYGDFGYSSAHLYAAMPLEYLGYGAVYQDVRQPLPSSSLVGRYAGVVTWFQQPIADGGTYHDWLRRQLEDGVRVAMLGDPGVDISGDIADLMHLQQFSQTQTRGAHVKNSDNFVGFEGLPRQNAQAQSGFKLTAGSNTQSHLELKDDQGDTFSTVVSGSWGGIALAPWVVQEGIEERLRWILDPFEFFTHALDLPPMPVPDATTENGSRYWMTQVDGDGFANRAAFPGTPFTGEVLLDEIFGRYRIPTTVSVIEGEVGPDGLYPDLSGRLEAIAQKIFRLPWVEIASHTYSHPFEWLSLNEGELTGSGKTAAGYNYNLPIVGYKYSLDKEIAGSTQYINDTLAPAGKRVKLVLWSGDALPPEKALSIAAKGGLENLNGGNTHATNDNSSLTNVAPSVRPLGDNIQVYSPQTNENVYTNLMTAPLWGFRRVIETYKLTNSPRRLKPIDIYFHFYSAGQPASLNALKDVFRYAQRQETLPLFASTYSRVVKNWYTLGVARRLDGGWQITGAENMRTLRLPASLGWPDMSRSDGVAGVRDIKQGRYVALSGQPRVILRTQSRPTAGPFIRRANGRIMNWSRDSQRTSFSLQSNVVPLEIELGGISGCRVNAPGARRQPSGDALTLRYSGSESGAIRIDCG